MDFRDALSEIAHDFAFSWHPEARALFERLDAETFARVDRNPVLLLAEMPRETLERAAGDEGMRADVERVRAAIAAEREAPVRVALADGLSVAYLRLWEKGRHASDYRYSIHTKTVGGRRHRRVVGGIRDSARRVPYPGHGPAGPVWVP